jgi:hypothetical protein
MSLFVECKSDETLAAALGVPRREIEHALGRASVCAQLARRKGVAGMVDEDPDSTAQPYLRTLIEQSWEHGVRLLLDKERNNRIIILSPRLEEWLVQAAKSSGLRMTDFGFDSDNGVQLHGEINLRLRSMERLLQAMKAADNQRIRRLQSVLKRQ